MITSDSLNPKPEPKIAILNIDEMKEIVLEQGIDVVNSTAKGLPLHSNGHLGADILRLEAGESFGIHTHKGDHLLLCVDGIGTISIGRETFEVKKGDIYFIAGDVPHAVGAHKDSHHTLIAFGAPHSKVDATDRMQAVDWDGNIIESFIYLQ